MNHERARTPEERIKTSFMETVSRLVENEKIDDFGVQEVICDLRRLKFNNAERETIGNSYYAQVQKIHMFVGDDDLGEVGPLEPTYLVEFYEHAPNSSTAILRTYQGSNSAGLVYSSTLEEYDNGKFVPGRDKELLRELNVPEEERDPDIISELLEILINQQEAKITPADDPQRFEAVTNILHRFVR